MSHWLREKKSQVNHWAWFMEDPKRGFRRYATVDRWQQRRFEALTRSRENVKPLNSQDISELHFLVDALVSAPLRACELVALVLDGGPSERFTEAARLLEEAFTRYAARTANWQALVIRDLRERDIAVGDAVAWAVHNRPHRRRRHRQARRASAT